MKILLVWIVAGCLGLVEVLPSDGGVVVGECQTHLVAGYEAGFICPLTEAGIRSIPGNSSALRLVSVQTTATRRSNLTLPPLAALRTLEIDVTGGALRPRSPFARLPDLVRLQLFHVAASSADDFRFVLRAGTFEGCSGLRQLILPDLGITEIPVGAFRGLRNLRILELNHNRLSRIRNATFLDCCHLLSSLSLARNRISDLTLLSWTGLSGLRTLDLSSNLVSVLPERGFEGLGSLVGVDLTGNRIHTIAPMAFAALGTLRELILNDNQLRGLQRRSFQGLESLETLELRMNNITGDLREVFGDLRSLTRLDLSQNWIQSLSPEYFETLSNLTDLGLRSNRLTTLDPRFRRIFDRLSSLDLSSNPWNCNCRILWLAEWLQHAGSVRQDLEITSMEDIRCSQPTAMMELTSFLNYATDCKVKHPHPSTVEWPLQSPTRKPETPKPEIDSTAAADVTVTSMTSTSGVTNDVRTFCGLTTTEIAEVEKLKTLDNLIESVTKNLRALDSLLITTVSKIDTFNRLLTATIKTIEKSEAESSRTDNVAPDNVGNNASNSRNSPSTRYVCMTMISIVFVSFR